MFRASCIALLAFAPHAAARTPEDPLPIRPAPAPAPAGAFPSILDSAIILVPDWSVARARDVPRAAACAPRPPLSECEYELSLPENPLSSDPLYRFVNVTEDSDAMALTGTFALDAETAQRLADNVQAVLVRSTCFRTMQALKY